MSVISVLMNKGGVGKTTLTTNLACALIVSDTTKKVLVVDCDAQGNASIAFGKNPNSLDKTLYDCMVEGESYKEALIHINNNIDILPANDEMNYLELDVLTKREQYPNPFILLKPVIDKLKSKYDYIFIDSPPSMGLMAANILMVSDRVIIPFVPESFSVQGLIRVVQTIKDFKQEKKIPLEIAGVVSTMVDSRTSLHEALIAQAELFCQKKGVPMLKGVISKTIRVASATAAYGIPIVLLDPKSKFSKVYFDLLEEILDEKNKITC